MLIIFLIATIDSKSQIGTTLPSSRRENWDKSGLSEEIPKIYDDSVFVAPGASIQDAVRAAHSKNGLVVIHLRRGVHYIEAPLILEHSVVLKGAGSSETTLAYVGESVKASDLIIVRGRFHHKSVQIESYEAGSNSILLDSTFNEIQLGSYVEIFIPPSSGSCVGQECVGKIVRIRERNANASEFQLEDDLSLTWSLRGEHTMSVRLVEPAEEVGIEDMTIRPMMAGQSNGDGTAINFYYAVNCWVSGIRSFRPVRTHIGIGRSARIYITRCHFLLAEGYGAGGRGYGVSVANRSTACLIEDNVFEHLRHAMVVSMGANSNVFAYNYSLDQYDEGGYRLGDISIHGHYPYANLFEGNYVDRIHADVYHSDNGPFNTFLRNYTVYKTARVEIDDMEPSEVSPAAYNLLGNESTVSFVEKVGPTRIPVSDPPEAISFYGFSSGMSEPTEDPRQRIYWEKTGDHEAYLPDISYYLVSKPLLVGEGFTWPPMGPPTTPYGSVTSQTIPARVRWQRQHAQGIHPGE